MLTKATRRAVLSTMASALAPAALARGMKPETSNKIYGSMVVVSYVDDTNAAADPTLMDVVGWVVAPNRVLTTLPKRDLLVAIGSHYPKTVSFKSEDRLALMDVELDLRPKGLIEVADSLRPKESLYAFGRRHGRTQTQFDIAIESMAAAHPPYERFLRIPSYQFLASGAGIFSREGKLVTIVVGAEEASTSWALVARSESIRRFLDPVK